MAIHVVVVITKLDVCAFQWIKSIWNRFRNSPSRMVHDSSFYLKMLAIFQTAASEKKVYFLRSWSWCFSFVVKISDKVFFLHQNSLNLHIASVAFTSMKRSSIELRHSRSMQTGDGHKLYWCTPTSTSIIVNRFWTVYFGLKLRRC